MATLRQKLWWIFNGIGSRFIPSWKRHIMVGPPALWKAKREFQIGFLKGQDLGPGENLLDIGCGTLRGGVPLIEYLEPGRYVGIDVRESAIKEARKELEKNRLGDKQATLTAFSDFNSLDLGRKFDKIWSFSVIFHMTDEIVASLMAFIPQHLADGGKYFANIHRGEENSSDVWEEFPVNYRPLAFYEDLAEQNGLALENIGPIKDHGHNVGIPEQDDQEMLVFTRK